MPPHIRHDGCHVEPPLRDVRPSAGARSRFTTRHEQPRASDRPRCIITSNTREPNDSSRMIGPRRDLTMPINCVRSVARRLFPPVPEQRARCGDDVVEQVRRRHRRAWHTEYADLDRQQQHRARYPGRARQGRDDERCRERDEIDPRGRHIERRRFPARRMSHRTELRSPSLVLRLPKPLMRALTVPRMTTTHTPMSAVRRSIVPSPRCSFASAHSARIPPVAFNSTAKRVRLSIAPCIRGRCVLNCSLLRSTTPINQANPRTQTGDLLVGLDVAGAGGGDDLVGHRRRGWGLVPPE